jgi:acyl carrier protein
VRAAVLERVRQFVRETFMYAKPDAALEDDTPLLGRGILDSMGVVELIEFVQAEFSITIEDDEITEDHLGTLAAIADYVASKRAAGVPE